MAQRVAFQINKEQFQYVRQGPVLVGVGSNFDHTAFSLGYRRL